MTDKPEASRFMKNIRLLVKVIVVILIIGLVVHAMITASAAAMTYKDRFGSYPASLKDLKSRLGWKIPDDPFSGKPQSANVTKTDLSSTA